MPKEDLLLGALSGALIVVSGACYALLFAFGKLRRSSVLLSGAYLSYGALIIFSLLLLHALDLEGLWTGVVIVMLAGYFLAPKGVWHLCVGTHGRSPGQSPGDSSSDIPARTPGASP